MLVKPRRFSHDQTAGGATTQKNFPLSGRCSIGYYSVFGPARPRVLTTTFTFAIRFQLEFLLPSYFAPSRRICAIVFAVPLGASFFKKIGTRKLWGEIPGPRIRPAARVDAKSALTPMLKFEARMIGTERAAVSIALRCSGNVRCVNDELDGYFHRRRAKIIRHIR